jgi:hypothetical protein
MFFIPLNQLESVELVVHALRMAGGQADCDCCPARRVCMKQCLTIAEAVEKMLQAGTLPILGQPAEGEPAPAPLPVAEPAPVPPTGGHLKLVK